MRPQLPITTLAATAALGSIGFATYTGAQALAAPASKAKPRIALHQSRTDVLAGNTALVRGALQHGGAGQHVVLQLRRNGHWSTVARAATRSGGAFSLRYRTARVGSLAARVRTSGAATSAIREIGRLDVYRRAQASWYGGPLIGAHVACGGRLTANRIGVANKTLPCGTKVTLRYHGRTVVAPVIDRGPYVGNREFDLTVATKNRLHFPGVATVLVNR